jgi:hypothetical protein
MPVTVWAWGWAQNPTTRAQKTSKVGAVKQPRKRSSRLVTDGVGGAWASAVTSGLATV